MFNLGFFFECDLYRNRELQHTQFVLSVIKKIPH